MNKKNQKFLERKLSELVDKDIISADQFEYAKSYFASSKGSRRNIITILSAIGILLMTLSIITLFAMNWTDIPKEIKVVVSFLPLVFSAIMLFFTMKNEDKKLGLYTSIVSPITIIATNSLLSQVFHIQTEIYEMFFGCMVMFLPIAFILRNYLSILVYGTCTVIYAFGAVSDPGIMLNTCLLAIPLIVYNIVNYRIDKENGKNSLMWVFNIILFTLLIIKWEFLRGESLFIYVYMIYLITKLLFDEENWLNVLLRNVFVIFLICSCITHWMVAYAEFITFGWDMLVFSLVAAAGVYLTKIYKDVKEVLLLVFLGLIQFTMMPAESLFIFVNIVAIIYGIYKIVLGNRDASYKEIKQGIAMILLLIMFRFVNADLDFTTKSVMFLIAGSGFLIGANILKKRIGGSKDE
ncbi:MAG: DUF2157 domain-containing protein [Clostridia bacterium]|nr:DUF2157 domain-containing protein [Clostridia bacterium]